MAGERLEQEGEGQAAHRVGVEIGLGGPQRAEAPGGPGLGLGHYGGGDGADFHARAAWQVEPVRLNLKVEGEHGIELLYHAVLMSAYDYWQSKVSRGGSVSRYSVSVPITGSPAG